MKRLLVSVVLLLMFAFPLLAQAETLTGVIQGFNCVTQGKNCPVGMEDPLVMTERTFVLLQDDGDYYLIPNLDRALLARYVAKSVRVTGTLESKFNAVYADKLEYNVDGDWKTAWSKEKMEEFHKQVPFYRDQHPLGH
jgi:hypothetical protein